MFTGPPPVESPGIGFGIVVITVTGFDVIIIAIIGYAHYILDLPVDILHLFQGEIFGHQPLEPVV